MIKKISVASVLTFLVFFIFSCNDSYATMIDELNASFIPVATLPSITDPEYDFSKMINLESYTVPEDCMFNLSGPVNAMSYKWQVYSPSSEYTPSKTDGVVIGDSINLAYNMEGGAFKKNTENLLVLTIVTPGGATQIDTAKIYLASRE